MQIKKTNIDTSKFTQMKKLQLFYLPLLIVLALSVTKNVSAQKLKDRINSAKEKTLSKANELRNGEASSSSSSNAEFINNSETAKLWESGTYDAYGIDGFLTVADGDREVVISKNSQGDVESVQIGDEVFKTDVSNKNPIVLNFHKEGSTRNAYFTEDGISVYHYWKGSGSYEELNIIYFIGAKKKPKTAIKEIKAYREEATTRGAAAEKEYEDNAAAERAAQAAAREAEFGLTGKDVVKIEFVDFEVADVFGHWSPQSFSFSLQATLKDGTVISTKNSNEGFRSDYSISYDEKSYIGSQLQTGWSADDMVTITVKCDANPSLVISKDVNIKYNMNIAYLRNGLRYGQDPGGPADNFKVEVKQVKHEQTGEPLLQYRLTNMSTGALVDEAKISPDNTLILKCSGASGGVDEGTPQRGGNGGHILVIKDPSVERFDFEYYNSGGQGGAGPYNSAPDGRDGTYKEKIQAVNF